MMFSAAPQLRIIYANNGILAYNSHKHRRGISYFSAEEKKGKKHIQLASVYEKGGIWKALVCH